MQDNSAIWTISATGKRITYNSQGISTDKDIEDLILAVQTTVDNQNLGYSEGVISRAVKAYIMELYQFGISNIYKNVIHVKQRENACDKWLLNVYNFFRPTESFEVFAMMMKHWGWQVKRKMLSRPVVHHVWLNFFGATGTGKSTFIKKLCAPFDDVLSTTTISKLFDDTREIKRLTENFILFFDELGLNVENEESGKLNADQKAILKSIITGDLLDARVYGSQNQAKKKITFSCISAANNHLYDIIFDETSMRRFFEFHCTAEPVADFSEINKTLDNSIYFWNGVDEDLERGYFDPSSELGKQVTDAQRKYYPTKSSVFDWATETSARSGNGTPASAYKAYKQYCINAGIRNSKNMANFIADIRHLLPEAAQGNTVKLDFTRTKMCLKDCDDDGMPQQIIGTPVDIKTTDSNDSIGNYI